MVTTFLFLLASIGPRLFLILKHFPAQRYGVCEEFGSVGFFVVCFPTQKQNPNHRQFDCVGKKWLKRTFFTYYGSRIIIGWGNSVSWLANGATSDSPVEPISALVFGGFKYVYDPTQLDYR